MLSGLRQLLPCDRRHFLERTAQTLLGVTIAPALARAADGKPIKPNPPGGNTAKNVIYLYMAGAMSHLDTFDLKPGREVQGETKPISTSVASMQFGERLPELAKLADRLAIVRSLHTETADHEQGRYLLKTSYKEIASIRHPGMGAWAIRLKGARPRSLPDNVLIGPEGRHPGAGFLEPSMTPVPIGDPIAGLQNTRQPEYLTEASFDKRLELINKFDAGFRKKYPQKQVEAYTEFYRQATELMSSQDLKAFDLNQEKDDIRDKYGRDRFGQGCLLARRLVEHDVRFIEVSLDGWDMHTEIYERTKLPEKTANLDRALSALLLDLESRGLLKSTLVVLGTEFGRTPKLNPNAGRDHHPGAFSAVLAGGGAQGGRYWGSTDADGFRPASDDSTPADLNATIAWAMGLPLHEEVFSKSGRPFKVAHEGQPLVKLFS